MSEDHGTYEVQPVAGRRDQFMYFVQHARQGEFQLEASDKLTQAVQRALATRLATSITIKIKIKPYGAQLEISDTIAVTLPELPRPGTVMFADIGGGLSRSNPNQRNLDLRNVDEPGPDAGELRVPVDPAR